MSISPEYMQPLREEVESVIAEQGWTRASLLSMRKLDSFLRETFRISGASTSEQSSLLDQFLHKYILTLFQLEWSAKP